jgi:hypothetical protein
LIRKIAIVVEVLAKLSEVVEKTKREKRAAKLGLDPEFFKLFFLASKQIIRGDKI